MCQVQQENVSNKVSGDSSSKHQLRFHEAQPWLLGEVGEVPGLYPMQGRRPVDLPLLRLLLFGDWLIDGRGAFFAQSV